MIEYIRIAVASATLLYSSYLDLKKREVEDWVWVIASVIGASANLYFYIASSPPHLYLYGVAVASTAGVVFALYWAGMYGGADAKALTCLAAVHPTVDYGIQFHRITGLTTFTNGMLLSASLPLSLAVYNTYRLARGEKIFAGFETEPTIRKLLACFIGTRVLKSSEKRFWSAVEKWEGGVRRFDFNISIDKMDKAGADDMWITPGIPLLVFFTMGYFLSLTFGDIMAALFHMLGWRPG